jgi:uncharacterized MAPEG superfamily protein
MTTDLLYLLASAALTWVMLLAASVLRNREWTAQGAKIAAGPRDHVPEPPLIAGRADRAASNMLENLVLFAVLLFVARSAGVDAGRLAPGAAVFFWARIVFCPAYLTGVPYLRTVMWVVSIVGMGMIVAAMGW